MIARAVDAVLEASVVGSFSRIGYHARRRLDHWRDLASYDLRGRTAIVTGATSGLGRETAAAAARRWAPTSASSAATPPARSGAAAELQRDTGGTVEAALADLSLLADVRALARRAGGAARHGSTCSSTTPARSCTSGR